MEKALGILDSTVKIEREARGEAAALQQHQDNALIWITGLASGAVLGLPAIYNYIFDLKSMPRWVVAIPMGLFALAVILGVVLRLFLAKLMQVDSQAAYAKVNKLELLKIRRFEGEQGRQRLLEEALAIVEDREATISGLKAKVDKITRRMAIFELWPFVFFALGILSAAILVVCIPLN
jgi:hypothetical protein